MTVPPFPARAFALPTRVRLRCQFTKIRNTVVRRLSWNLNSPLPSLTLATLATGGRFPLASHYLLRCKWSENTSEIGFQYSPLLSCCGLKFSFQYSWLMADAVHCKVNFFMDTCICLYAFAEIWISITFMAQNL